MPKSLIRFALCIAPLALGVAVLAIYLHFEQRLKRGTAAHVRAMEDSEKQFARQRAARQVAAHEENLERLKRRREELRQAAGSDADFAVKDPELALVPMFEKLATACAPAGVRTRVQIDRFTEFDLYFDFDTLPDRTAAGELAVCVLKRSAPFIHALHLSQRGKLLAELDVLGVQAVSDWSTVNGTQAAQMLNWELGDRAVPTTKSDESSNGAGDAGEGDPRFEAVMTRHFAGSKSQLEALNAVLQHQASVLQLTAGTTLDQLRQNVEGLKRGMESLGAAKAHFQRQFGELEAALRQAGFEELFIRIALRGEHERDAKVAASRDRVFAVTEQYNESAQSFLEAMIKHWGHWSVDPDGSKVRFDTEAAQTAYSQYLGPVEIKARQVSAAMEAMNSAAR